MLIFLCLIVQYNSSVKPMIIILTVPLFHVTGCVPVMLGSFGLGFKLVMMFKWEPRRALELVDTLPRTALGKVRRHDL